MFAVRNWVEDQNTGTDLDLPPSRDNNGFEPDGYPTRGRVGIPCSPAEPVC